MDYLEAVQLSAFDIISKIRRREGSGDPDYIYRRIFRWYAKTFNTPLHEVYDLPVHDVLTAYWEEYYEAKDDHELEEERLELIKTEEDRAKDQLRKDYEELEFFEDSKFLEQDSTPINKLATEADKFKDALNRFREGVMGKETSMTEMPVTTNLPPNITMRFVDHIDEDEDSLGMLDDPKK